MMEPTRPSGLAAGPGPANGEALSHSLALLEMSPRGVAQGPPTRWPHWSKEKETL